MTPDNIKCLIPDADLEKIRIAVAAIQRGHDPLEAVMLIYALGRASGRLQMGEELLNEWQKIKA